MSTNLNKTAYKCSKCHAYGHNSRTCGQTPHQQPNLPHRLPHPHTTTPTPTTTQQVVENSSVNNAWNKLSTPSKPHFTDNPHKEAAREGLIVGAVEFSTVAAMKREIDKDDRVLVCLDNQHNPAWMGVLLYPVQTMTSEVKCKAVKLLEESEESQKPIITYFGFPKASEVVYNQDGSFTQKKNGRESTWVMFNTAKDAKKYVHNNKEKLKNKKAEIIKANSEREEKKKEEARRAAEENKKRWEMENEKKKKAYAENPTPCSTNGCPNLVPYKRGNYRNPLCDSCEEIKEKRAQQRENLKKEETLRMLGKVKQVKTGEKCTVITRPSWMSAGNPAKIHKNVRLATTMQGREEVPMFLPPRARRKGYIIPPSAVIVNSKGEVIYSGHDMVEECKQVIMENSDYTEVEAETYAIFLSQA